MARPKTYVTVKFTTTEAMAAMKGLQYALANVKGDIPADESDEQRRNRQRLELGLYDAIDRLEVAMM